MNNIPFVNHQQQQQLQRAQGAKMGRAHCLQKEETERAGGEGGQTKRADQRPESNAPAQILTESGKGKRVFPA